MKKIFLILAAFLSSNLSFADHYAKSHYEDASREISLNDKLIFAVKGAKFGYALMVGMLNPVAGLGVALTDTNESGKDLLRIDKLLQEGAEIDYQDPWGYTALNYAAYYGYPHIAKHLVKRGANPNIAENESYTPCQMARHYLSKNQKMYQHVKNEKDLKKRSELLIHYEDLINRYFEIYNLLHDLGTDCSLKSSWF